MKRIHALVFTCVLAIAGAFTAGAQTAGTQITYTETTTTPGATVQTPFGPKQVDQTSSTVQKTIAFDGANAAAFSALCQNAPVPVAPALTHLTATQLAAQYTPAELSAALSAAFAPKN